MRHGESSLRPEILYLCRGNYWASAWLWDTTRKFKDPLTPKLTLCLFLINSLQIKTVVIFEMKNSICLSECCSWKNSDITKTEVLGNQSMGYS